MVLAPSLVPSLVDSCLADDVHVNVRSWAVGFSREVGSVAGRGPRAPPPTYWSLVVVARRYWCRWTNHNAGVPNAARSFRDIASVRPR